MAYSHWYGRRRNGNRPPDRRKIKSGDSAALLHKIAESVKWHYIMTEREKTGGRWVPNADDYTVDHPKVIEINGWRVAISTLMERTCSVIGEETVPVEWVMPDGPFANSIAFTDGETIYFGLGWFLDSFLGALYDRNVEGTAAAWSDIKAVAYHELAHVLYTPRRAHRPTKTFRTDASLFKVYNILEDLRIESLFVTRYSPAKPILIDAVLRHVVDWGRLLDESDEVTKLNRLAAAWVFTWGRGYLPPEIHHACANGLDAYLARYGGDKTRADFERIVAAYRRCVFPADADLAIELVTEFRDLLDETGLGWIDPRSDGHSEHKEGRAEPIARTRETSEEMEDSTETPAGGGSDDSDESSDTEAEGTGAGTGEDGEGEGEGGTGTGTDDVDGDVDGEGAGDGDISDFDDAEPLGSAGGDAGGGSDGEETEGGTGSSAGNGIGTGSDLDDLTDRLRDALDSAASEVEPVIDADVRSSIKAARSIIDGIVAVPSVNDTFGNNYHDVEPWMRAAARSVTTEVSRVFSDADESWVGGHSSGRLNVGAVMDARGRHFDVFDVFEDNTEEATSFEVVLLVDRSDSMGSGSYNPTTGTWGDNRMVAASKAAWILKSAFAELNIPVTIVGYGTDVSMVSTAGTAADRHTFTVPATRGGTNPKAALPWVVTLLKSSDAHNRLLISISDGEWHIGSDEANDLRALRTVGVKSLFVGIDSPTVRVPTIDGLPYGHHEYVALTADTLRRLPHEVGRRISKLAGEYASV